MKKFKIVAALIFIVLISLTIYQNQDYFMTKKSLDFNFYFSQYQGPEAANGIYWLGCFAAGFLLSYFSSLIFRFKSQKKLKIQNQTIENYRETVQELKREIEKIKESGYLNLDNAPNKSFNNEQYENAEQTEDEEDEESEVIQNKTEETKL
ncbi:MAG: hypothetical protein ACQEQS_05280 [Thermodesulfobacteriota bacterium]